MENEQYCIRKPLINCFRRTCIEEMNSPCWVVPYWTSHKWQVHLSPQIVSYSRPTRGIVFEEADGRAETGSFSTIYSKRLPFLSNGEMVSRKRFGRSAIRR